jgi:tetratricopeptide (TPR) repeat protein
MSIAAAELTAKPADPSLIVEKLMRLRKPHERRQLIARHPHCQNRQFIVQLEHKARELLRVQPRESLALSGLAFDLANLLRDDLAMAHAVRMKGNAEYALAHYSAAVKLYSRAIQLFERLGEKTELGRTLSVSILSLNLCGRYDAALEAAERARKIFRELGDELRLARVDINAGNVCYRQDRFSEALDCYQRAYRVVLDRHDAEAIGVVLSNLAVCLISLGQFPEALRAYEEARQVCAGHGMPRLVAQADYNIAYLYYLRGEYSRAIDMLRATRAACAKVDDPYHHALCNLDLAELYLELNLSTEAADLAHEAHAEFATLGMDYEKAKTLVFQAMASSQKEHWTQGLQTFAEARKLFTQERNPVWPSLIDLYCALLLFNMERYGEAARLAKTAVEFFDSSVLPGKAVLGRLLLARIAQKNGDLETAQKECLIALEKLSSLQTPALKHEAFLLMGQIHTALGNGKAAYSSLRESRSCLERLRNNVRGQELKLAFLKNRIEVYEALVRVCLEDPSETSLQEAFGYVEEAKSRLLMDQMLRPLTNASSQDAQSELAQSILNLRNELNGYYRLIELEQLRSEARSRERVRRLEEQVIRREIDLLRLLQEVGAGDVGREETSLENVALANIREQLSPETSVVEYFQIGDRIVAFLLTNNVLEVHPLGSASRLAGALRLLRFQLAKFRLGSEYANAFLEPLIQSTHSHLRTLYQELLAPFRRRLQTPHLLIVPHGCLHYVPFHALFDGTGYVIDDYAVSYSPSASIYSLCRTKAVNTCGSTLLMGIPDEKAPLIEQEIQSLRSLLPHSKAYFGDSATEDVLRRDGPSSRAVHIATHGRFRQDNPTFSSIRLGTSYLSLYDLYRLQLPVELVTLSGCATGLNAIQAGDELIGLARGLFQAGAQSLLLTLWDAHDASTTDCVIHFYRQLLQGRHRAAALRQAMFKVRERCPHPYHWAPFVLMGAHGPLADGYADVSQPDSVPSASRGGTAPFMG